MWLKTVQAWQFTLQNIDRNERQLKLGGFPRKKVKTRKSKGTKKKKKKLK